MTIEQFRDLLTSPCPDPMHDHDRNEEMWHRWIDQKTGETFAARCPLWIPPKQRKDVGSDKPPKPEPERESWRDR